MEYTIYSESLVYYTIRKDGKYYNHNGEFAYGLMTAKAFDSKDVVEALVQNVPQLKDAEIRKIKMIDIGEA